MRNVPFVLTLAAATAAGACDSQSPAAASRVPDAASQAAQPAASASDSSTAQLQSQAPATLVDVTTGFTGTSNNFVGQSVTVPGHGWYKNLRFNWYDSGGNPVAFGTLYLLDHEYLGTPAGLSPSTPGFIAESTGITGGQYVFDSKVKIRGASTYWFYTDSEGAFYTGFATDTYPGGDMYVVGMADQAFHMEPTTPSGGHVDANFRLQGK